MENNILFCSAGRRVKLLEDFRKTLGESGKLVVADNSILAPTVYVADKHYIVPKIYDENYIDIILDICKKEKIKIICTLIDPEIKILADNREKFEELGILVMVPTSKTAELCFDKFEMYKYLKNSGIDTVTTYGTVEEFENNKEGIGFPVFVKPRTGSGSVGARKVEDIETLKKLFKEDETLIIQELMTGKDLDADVYVDTISGEVISVFSKNKLETKIGGANKTVAFKDEKLNKFIEEIVSKFEFKGTINMDFFKKEDTYYLSEVNPRFGGGYIHPYAAGVDFIKYLIKNSDGQINKQELGNYEDGSMMMMYDDIVFVKPDEVKKDLKEEKMKKKLVIIANFTTLPFENGNSRFIYLANLIDKSKFDVEIITSDFFHTKKEKRDKKDERLNKFDYKVTLIDEPIYTKNISLKRFYSHYVFAKNVKKYLEKIDKPDIIYAAVPSLDVANVAAEYANKNNIRFIIDVQDLWPEAFKMVLNIPIISDIIFLPMTKMANKIYSMADNIIAVSDTYVNRALRVNKKSKENLGIYLGTDLDYFDECLKKNKVEKNEDIFQIAYLGTLGASYDIRNVLDAIKILNDKKINNLELVLIGNGPQEEKFKEYAKQLNVKCDFKGYLGYEKLIPILCNCDIAVNPIRKGAAQSIVNKVGDYAASALPVISTQEAEEYRKLVDKYNIGFNIENDNPNQMADKILELYNNKILRKTLGKNNRKLAEEKFNRKTNYSKIIDLILKG